jgi:hypothetical protein
MKMNEVSKSLKIFFPQPERETISILPYKRKKIVSDFITKKMTQSKKNKRGLSFDSASSDESFSLLESIFSLIFPMEKKTQKYNMKKGASSEFIRTFHLSIPLTSLVCVPTIMIITNQFYHLF